MIKSEKCQRSTINDVTTATKTFKWTWAGHIQRYNDYRWAKKIENWVPKSSRKSGRPKKRWKDEIEEYASLFWRRRTLQREKWKTMGKSFVLRN